MIDITADDGERAIEAAASAISPGDYDRVEVWDGEALLLTKTTRRAWDALGDAPPPEHMAVTAEQAPRAPGLPRRVPTFFTSGLRALGLGGGASRWKKAATRKS